MIEPTTLPRSEPTQPIAAGRLTSLSIFLADLDGGGAERMMVAIANGMARRGVDVELVTARAAGPYLSEVDPAVTLVDLATGSVTRALLPLSRHLRRGRPDLLLSTLAHASVVAAAARKLSATGVPLVLREANTPTGGAMAWTSWKSNLAHYLMRWAYRTADGVIAVSDGVAQALQGVIGLPPERIATLYNPVVTDELHELAQLPPDHPWFAAGEPPVILGVGSLTPRKDFRTLIAAFASIAQGNDLRLVILGEGPERDDLQRLVDGTGLADRIDLPGFKRNPYAYMSRAAVYVLSSHLEGLPGSLVQALACGCPSVATDCPSGPHEILQGGRIGPLVPVGDAAAMAAGIEAMLRSPPPASLLTGSVAKYAAQKVLDETHAYLGRVSTRRVSTRRVRTRRRAASRRG